MEFLAFLGFFAVGALFVGAYYGIVYLRYIRSAYFKCTGISYRAMCADTGRYGEYLVYKYLEEYEHLGAKFLFNLYIPKSNGKTSEIDVVMLCNKGIFVFESKNYSGWIFGKENQKNWYQTLPTNTGKAHKEEFYNPIMQNYNHIRHLRSFIDQKIPMWSIIAFSDRCTLKDVRVMSKYIHVINRYDIENVVGAIWDKKKDVLSNQEVEQLYEKLLPLTQVDEATKKLHIQNIQKSIDPSHFNNEIEDFGVTTEDAESSALSEIDKILGSCDIDVQEDAEEKVDLTEIEKVLNNTTEQFLEIEPPKESPQKCPRCGADLVLRVANKGENKGKQFYGCASYPKCRFVKNISE